MRWPAVLTPESSSSIKPIITNMPLRGLANIIFIDMCQLRIDMRCIRHYAVPVGGGT